MFRKKLIKIAWVGASLLVLLAMTGCSLIRSASATLDPAVAETTAADITEADADPDEVTRPEGWTTASHSDDVDPDYATVFPQDQVNRIEIAISAENWASMNADMTEMMGEFGSGDMAMGPGGRPQMGDGELPEQPEGERPPFRGNQDNPPEGGFRGQPGGQGLPGAGNLDFTEENPIWVTATITFEGQTWEHVGIRFKGNSSLRSAWSSGSLKIPFKLDFDQFEDDYPEIDDQRFFGFKQLSLASNFNDASFLREKVTADIFRDFGVPSAHTAFYEVYVDTGDGLAYFGLYTMVEMVEDTVISEQFDDEGGNLYKPEGNGATFAEGSFSEASFDKETNQDEDDYSDIQGLLEVLHSDLRLSDPQAWRSKLEALFDVDTFLRWLAVNTVVQNWDTYGVMSHNYFLYTDPADGLITWIPWDNNHALNGASRSASLSLDLTEVTDRWPLIRYLADDPVYKAQYEAYLAEVIETVFVPEEMAETYQFYHDLVADSVLKETDAATTLRSEAAFAASLAELIDHTLERVKAVRAYLAE